MIMPFSNTKRTSERFSFSDVGKRVAGGLASGLRRLFATRANGRPGILVYHRIADPIPGVAMPTMNVPPARFRSQLSGLLRSGYRPLALPKLIELQVSGQPVPPSSFLVTFDDGFANNFTQATPILRELGIPATVFVSTAYLDRNTPFPFDRWGCNHSGSVPVDAYRPLTRAECKTMTADGLIQIGSHTHTHADFRGNLADFKTDIALSVEELQTLVGSEQLTFAFPFGRRALGYVHDDFLNAARSAGVSCALTTEAELVGLQSDPFGWGRFNAYHWDTADTLSAKLAGWYGWAPRLQERLAATMTVRRA